MRNFMKVSMVIGIGMLALSGCGEPTYNRPTGSMSTIVEKQRSQIEMQESEIARLADEVEQRNDVINSLLAQAEQLKSELNLSPISVPEFIEKEIEVEKRGNEIVITVAGDVLFKSGRYSLSKNSQKILTKVSSVLKKSYSGRTIRIAGHTDNDPVKSSVKGGLKDNMELSFRRADAVMKFMNTHGMKGETLHIAAFGDTRPRSSNNTKLGKSQNRRVEIIIMPDLKVLEETIEVSSK